VPVRHFSKRTELFKKLRPFCLRMHFVRGIIKAHLWNFLLLQIQKKISKLLVCMRDGHSRLGAGTGAYTLPLAEKVGETGRVYAVEVQKDFLTNIKNEATSRGLKNVELLWETLRT